MAGEAPGHRPHPGHCAGGLDTTFPRTAEANEGQGRLASGDRLPKPRAVCTLPAFPHTPPAPHPPRQLLGGD